MTNTLLTFKLLDIPIANLTLAAALERIMTAVREPAPCPVEMHFANAHCINVAARDADYRHILQTAHSVFADGSGIRYAAKLYKIPLVDNVNGTDLFPLLCTRLAEEQRRLYLLGAAPGIAAQTGEWADQHVGQPITAGSHHGYLDAATTPEVIDQINTSGADVLLVAMGVPAQEKWLRHHQQQLRVPVVMGVGGLFDFFSGNIPRAPLLLRRLGVEWIWRLLMEPRRMWRRYLLGNVEFLWRIWCHRPAKKPQL